MSYRNPVVRGHAPDPSIVRVGDDYFLASSSFDKVPGIPIRHSRDLVNWTVVGYAITRPSQYRRDGEDGPIELFAPTIRHHDGIWYYSRRSFEPGRPDGSLGPIVTTTIDVSSGELGRFRDATPDDRGFVTNDIEGPHLFRRGEWYYLTAAEGSSWKGHMQTIGRSRSPWGPFEPAPHNPIITHRDRVGHPIQSLGHADFVEAADGRWWAVALGTRHLPLAQHHNIGRETFLLPVTWTDDGWPLVGEGGGTELVVDTMPPQAAAGADIAPVVPGAGSDGWVGLSAGSRWRWEGERMLVAGGDSLDSGRDAGAVLRAQTADDQLFEATLVDFPEDSAAGIAIVTDRRHHAAVLVSGTGGARTARLVVDIDGLASTAVREIPGGTPVCLRIECRPDSYVLRVDDIEIGRVTARLLSAEAAEWFAAAHFALVHEGSGEAGFTCVEMHDLEPQPLEIVPPFLRG